VTTLLKHQCDWWASLCVCTSIKAIPQSATLAEPMYPKQQPALSVYKCQSSLQHLVFSNMAQGPLATTQGKSEGLGLLLPF
jgi:hypothetical protein